METKIAETTTPKAAKTPKAPKAAKKCKVSLKRNFEATFPEFKTVFAKYAVLRIEFKYLDPETKKEVTSWFNTSGTKLRGYTDAK